MKRGFVERHLHPELLNTAVPIPALSLPIHTKMTRVGAFSTAAPKPPTTFGITAMYWDTIIYDRTVANYPGYGYNPATSLFTCPVTGFYRLTAKTIVAPTSSTGFIELAIYKNGGINSPGSIKNFNQGGNAGGLLHGYVDDIIACIKDDYIYTVIFADNAYTGIAASVYSYCTVDWAGYQT